MGVGQHLKRLLQLFGIRSGPKCPCMAYAIQMDDWGPEGCEARMGEIVAHLEGQAGKRRLPFSRLAAEQLVRMAIRSARRDAAKSPPISGERT